MFLFSAIAFAICNRLNKNELLIYENGVTSINIPIQVDTVNARASRTTHPKTLGLFERFYRRINANFKITTPYRANTKSEIVEKLRSYQAERFIASSISCSSTRSKPQGTPHCGACSQCIDRKFAMYAMNLDDEDDLYAESYIFSVILFFRIPHITAPKERKGEINGDIPAPNCQLFQIHGNIFESDPVRDPRQTSMLRIAHCMLLLRVRKHALNCLFPLRVKLPTTLCLPKLFDQIQMLLPDMSGGGKPLAPSRWLRICICSDNLCIASACCGSCACRPCPSSCGSIFLRADRCSNLLWGRTHIPRVVSFLRSLVSSVRQNRNSSALKNLFRYPRRLVPCVHHRCIFLFADALMCVPSMKITLGSTIRLFIALFNIFSDISVESSAGNRLQNA